MNVIINPQQEHWKKILQRPYVDNASVLAAVEYILVEVKTKGDAAIRAFTKQFDNTELNQLSVSAAEIKEAEDSLSPKLKSAIQQARKNIEKFHKAQLKESEIIETMPGVVCWRKSIGIEKVGIYIPGGTAALFSSVLMLGVPARLAGCKEVILCTPANNESKVHPAILYASQLTGITQIFKIGGAQAVAAMAFGTETVPAVYKIFGPGNQYVTAAKQLVQMQGIAIDMPAGPSEVCVLADETAHPAFIAADLLSQAEHGMDSQVLLVSTSEPLVKEVLSEIKRQLLLLNRKDIAEKTLSNSNALVVNDAQTAIAIVNEYAAEHLIICCKDAQKIAEKVTNAGSVFIGHYSPESAGDYASGTNHVLPTNGFAKAYSGVSIDSFVKKITFQKLSKEGLEGIADTVIEMAEAEGLQAHAEAVRVRRMEAKLKG